MIQQQNSEVLVVNIWSKPALSLPFIIVKWPLWVLLK